MSALLTGIDHRVLRGEPERVRITGGTCFDAGRAVPGSLYIAVPGHEGGGPEGTATAVRRGATAVLVQAGTEAPGAACVVEVADVRRAASPVSARCHGEPGRAMDVVAVTGTNGKTSVASVTESVLRLVADGPPAGVIGTGGSRIGDEPVPMPPSVLTTPEAPDLQYVLSRMRDGGVRTVVMEATSMGLLTHRVDDAYIDVGVFTNLTQDHLDDHGTMENYREAKLRLFRDGLCGHAVVNLDDPVGAGIPALMPDAVTTYGIDAAGADFRATDLVTDIAGTRFTLHHDGRKYPAAVPFPGRYSVANALAVLAACHRLGYEPALLAEALERVPTVPGRFERVDVPGGPCVVVDYAHSPDSLDKVLATVRGIARGRLITVFGCGGDRDETKRAEMGRIAGRHSDLCLLTSDNPRFEDPERILGHVEPGLAATGTAYERHVDRRAAIARALEVAGAEDTVVIAGKGSEPFQIVGAEMLPFSDVATVRELAGG
nr:UDP-N-acetylmuramoyl-L-alanyl-D-glutamate--2,6-diaminopimelate ligase [Streptomyces sp. HNM0574]